MRILVTGGSGLIGRALQEESENSEHEWIFSNSSLCDLTDYTQTVIYFGLRKPDYIIHLAANVGGLFKNLSVISKISSGNVALNKHICVSFGIVLTIL